jgi:serine/threonine protein kinase
VLQAAQIFRKMVEVVNHCHELGVMHRDLKPECVPDTIRSAYSRLVGGCASLQC